MRVRGGPNPVGNRKLKIPGSRSREQAADLKFEIADLRKGESGATCRDRKFEKADLKDGKDRTRQS